MSEAMLSKWVRSLVTPPALEPDSLPKPPPAHVGLWLDRLLDQAFEVKNTGWPARGRLYSAAEKALRPAARLADDPPAVRAYRPLFERWRRAVTAERSGSYRRVVVVEARSRVLLHPASGESVTEGAVLLHHTYGVPYLPGSALKGVARSWLLTRSTGENPTIEPGLAELLLGYLPARPNESEQGHAALIELLDALWVPEAPSECPEPSGWPGPLALDTSTPHHPDYSTKANGARPEPTPGDNPIPVPRLTVRPGTRFQLVAECAADLSRWCDWLVDRVLLPALEQGGIGAATNAGYGELRALRPAPGSKPAPRPTPAPAPEKPVRWEAGPVHWDPGSQELHAKRGQGRAFASRSSSAALIASLSDETRARLQGKRKEARLGLDVVREGSSWRIVALLEDAGG